MRTSGFEVRTTMRDLSRTAGGRNKRKRTRLSAPQAKVRILLADDRLLVRSGLRALIQSRDDFEVCAEASDGRSAVKSAARYRPHVAILDMMLPAVDGIEAARQIRQAVPATEVLIFADHQSDDAFYNAVLAGARGYLCKWEADERIVAAIETLARHGEFYSSRPPGSTRHDIADSEGSAGRRDTLTPREHEIVRLIAEGKRNKKIAHMLGISTKTVEAHRAASLRKLGAHSTAQLVRYAIRCGLIRP